MDIHNQGKMVERVPTHLFFQMKRIDPEEFSVGSKKRKVSEGAPFYGWTWEEVKVKFNISDFGLNTFSPPTVDIPVALVANIENKLQGDEDNFGPCKDTTNEATRKEFISSVLKCVRLHFPVAELRWFCEVCSR